MPKQITITNDFDETITLREGGAVFFKSDVEQIGGIVKIDGHGPSAWVTIEPPTGGFRGDYIRRQKTYRTLARDLTPMDADEAERHS